MAEQDSLEEERLSQEYQKEEEERVLAFLQKYGEAPIEYSDDEGRRHRKRLKNVPDIEDKLLHYIYFYEPEDFRDKTLEELNNHPDGPIEVVERIGYFPDSTCTLVPMRIGRFFDKPLDD